MSSHERYVEGRLDNIHNVLRLILEELVRQRAEIIHVDGDGLRGDTTDGPYATVQRGE